MKMKSKYLLILTIFTLGLAATACSDWLDVKPKTLVREPDMYDSESGFKDIVTGFYIMMTNQNLYGKNLTYGWMEMLAQRYDDDVLDGDNRILQGSPYTYTGGAKSYVDQSYSSLYNVIANINKFIESMETYKSSLHTKNYYEIMKAESLGLRAFLHFDLLRMYGPVYRLNPDAPSISYRTKYDIVPTKLLPAIEVCDSILSDLQQAHDILEEVDPKVFNFPVDQPDMDQFLVLRQLRMNYYATKALMARVYCYKNDPESKKMALKYAQEVIESPHFSLVETNASNPVLFGEHIFSLNVFELKKLIDPLYNPSNTSGLLQNKKETIEELYETKGAGTNDFRGKEQGFVSKGQVRILNKFNQDAYSGNYSGKDIVPLIRLAEMYYIAAECTESAAESAEYLNTIRQKRGIPSSDLLVGSPQWDRLDTRINFDNTKTMRVNEIMREYQKEFFGEGQLFFFYKRHNYRTFFNAPQDVDIRQYYVMPTHNDELSFGSND